MPADTPNHDRHGVSSEGRENDAHFAKHLDEVFSPLKFQPQLARRMLTHGSHKTAAEGHNGRLSFMGRRVLETYLLLFIHSSSATTPKQDHDLIVSRTLNTYVLGEHVAPKWRLEHVLRWSPTISADRLAKVTRTMGRQKREPVYLEDSEAQAEWVDVRQLGSSVMKSVGLHKVQGDAVQAVMGGIFHQFGGSVAHRVFHTRVLPHILLPCRADGLLDVFHEDALTFCQRMGGTDGPLLLERSEADLSGIQTSEVTAEFKLGLPDSTVL